MKDAEKGLISVPKPKKKISKIYISFILFPYKILIIIIYTLK